MILQANNNTRTDYLPHPEGVHPAVCVDVIDVGLVLSEFQGTIRMLSKVRLVFETEQRTSEGKVWFLARTFTASLNSRARLAEFLGKWRGRPIVPGEVINLQRLIGASCTLVIGHLQKGDRIIACIDAVSKPVRGLKPTGEYNPVDARKRVEQWKARALDKWIYPFNR